MINRKLWDRRAITFNAAGLSKTYRGSPGKIVANYIRGDILNFMQDISPLPDAAGTRVSFSGRGEMLVRHGSGQFTNR